MNLKIKDVLTSFKDNDFIDEYFNEDTWFFWRIIIGFFVVVAIILLPLMYVVNHSGGNKKISENTYFNVGKNDKNIIDNKINAFINADNSWGSNINKINKDNVQDFFKKDQKSQSCSDKKYFVSRICQYKNLRNNFLDSTSPIYYTDSDIINNWGTDLYSMSNLLNVSVDNINIDDTYKGVNINNNKNIKKVFVNVKFIDHQTTIEQTGTDSNWNGDYNVIEKNIPNSAQIILMKINNQWSVHDITNIKNNYPLVTWENYNDGYSSNISTRYEQKIIKQFKYGKITAHDGYMSGGK